MQSIKIFEISKHIGIIIFKGSTNLGLGLPTEDARSDDPRHTELEGQDYDKKIPTKTANGG